ncbi:AzlC family ABC transporter permease [Geminicoccus roseus]|uniref:AzlC family ABC transporter permease n=1 Tax=Geminicoccus roseus TaxID=404900 RepID=UPI000686C768|nr:AzlC family ABC transporter permease [Geminicoccus roseus]
MMEHSEDVPGVFTAAGFRRGAVGVLAIVPAAAAFGLVYGVAAAEKGMSLLEVALSCMVIFAGASQLVAMELWREPLPILAMVLSVLVINLRHLLMGATAAPWFRGVPGLPAFASLYFMTDESWGLAVAERRRGQVDAAYMLGAGVSLWVFWLAASMSGHALGDLVRGFDPSLFGWLITGFFVVLLAGFWRGAGDLLPWLVAAGVALATRQVLPGTWFVLTGALAGSLLGAWSHVRRR